MSVNAFEPETSACAERPIWQVRLSRLIADRNVIVERDRGFGPLPRHRFDRYTPQSGAHVDKPPIVFVYGGAWVSGERGCYAFAASALAAKGFETIVPDYRLFPNVQFPAFVDDIALAYAHCAFARKASQPPPILVGHSAGAHIAALIAGDPQYRMRADRGVAKPSGLVGISGPYAFDPTTWDSTAEIFKTTAHAPDVARPVTHAKPSFPPTLLIHGSRDTVVTPNAAETFRDALQAAGADVRVRMLSGIGHITPVLAFARPLRWVIPVRAAVVSFAEEIARGDVKSARPSRDIRTAGSGASA